MDALSQMLEDLLFHFQTSNGKLTREYATDNTFVIEIKSILCISYKMIHISVRHCFHMIYFQNPKLVKSFIHADSGFQILLAIATGNIHV